jgi:hypothetical protein
MTLGYSENSSHTGGMLTVPSRAQSASVSLLGNYMGSSFVMASDGHGGTQVTDTSQSQQQQPPLVSDPHG